jgi:hypothetical protein
LSPEGSLIHLPHEAAARIDVNVDSARGLVFLELTLGEGHRWIALKPEDALLLASTISDQALKLDPGAVRRIVEARTRGSSGLGIFDPARH